MDAENRQEDTARQHGAGVYVCMRDEGLEPLVQLIYFIHHRWEDVTKSQNRILDALKALTTSFQALDEG